MSLHRNTRQWLSRADGTSDLVLALMQEHFGVTPGTTAHQDAWESNRTELAVFVEQNGKLPVHRRSEPEELRLRKWMARQLVAVKSGELSEQQSKLLRSCSPLVQEAVEAALNDRPDASSIWEQRFAQLQQFIATNDRVPSKRAKDSEERRLGNWMDNQFKANTRAALPAEKAARIAQLHPNIEARLSTQPMKNKQWEERLEQLRKHLSATSTLPKQGETTPCAYMWLMKQRTLFSQGKLDQDQASKLFTLDPQVESYVRNEQISTATVGTGKVAIRQRWKRNQNAVDLYVAQHGKLPSTKNKAPETRRLAAWIQNYTRKQRLSGLEDWQLEALESACPELKHRMMLSAPTS